MRVHASQLTTRLIVAFAMAAPGATESFYCRYYVGHRGKFGHEFLEFEFRPDGKVRPRIAQLSSAVLACLQRGRASDALSEWLTPALASRVRAQLRYANNSNYKHDTMIRKEVYVTPEILAEVKRIIQDSEVRVQPSIRLFYEVCGRGLLTLLRR